MICQQTAFRHGGDHNTCERHFRVLYAFCFYSHFMLLGSAWTTFKCCAFHLDFYPSVVTSSRISYLCISLTPCPCSLTRRLRWQPLNFTFDDLATTVVPVNNFFADHRSIVSPSPDRIVPCCARPHSRRVLELHASPPLALFRKFRLFEKTHH